MNGYRQSILLVILIISGPDAWAQSSVTLYGSLDDAVAYYNNARILDAWGSPIVFISQLQPDLGLNVRGWFFFSAGPDRQYLTRDDNLYSYEQPVAQP